VLGRKTFTATEIEGARARIDATVAAASAIARANTESATNPKVANALAKLQPHFFNSLLLALDRPFVHRIRAVTGKDGNPLNEVELLCESLMDHGGVLTKNNVIKLDPEQSITGITYGDTIALTADEFTTLASAFFAELESKFGE